MKKEREQIDRTKIPMLRLVTEELHTKQCTDASAKEPNPQEKRFGGAPTVFFSLSLVQAIHGKRQKRHQGIESNCVFHRHLHQMISYYNKYQEKNQ